MGAPTESENDILILSTQYPRPPEQFRKRLRRSFFCFFRQFVPEHFPDRRVLCAGIRIVRQQLDGGGSGKRGKGCQIFVGVGDTGEERDAQDERFSAFAQVCEVFVYRYTRDTGIPAVGVLVRKF